MGQFGGKTTTSDAQSYITLDEFVRRAVLSGEYDNYKDTIEALYDESRPIDFEKLSKLIQVQKNFYYGLDIDNNTGLEVPNQIKNAEYVLIPRFLGNTELALLNKKMLDKGIAQANFISTEKATTNKILTFWNNEGNLTQEDIAKFDEQLTGSIKTGWYSNLYKQQDVPQHMDEENKAGIQIIKKMLDNINSTELGQFYIDQFFNNYNAGIGYKDTSTGTTKTVVSTDNNGAQIVIGDSNTGLTLATNARPKVLEDSTVKEVAYVSDIPNTSSFATLAGNNKWTGDNIFDGFSKSIRVNGLFQVSGDEEPISATYNQVSYDGFNIAYMVGENQNIFHVGIDFENKARFGFDKYDGSSYNLYIPEKDGTLALLSDIPNTSSFPTLAGSNNWTGQNVFDNGITMGTTEYTPEGPHVYYGDYRADYGERWISTQYQDKSGVLNLPQGKSGTLALIEDIPISLMYSSSKLGVNFVDFPFNIDKNYFFTITMTNTGESKSFIYAKGISATYTIVVNSSTSFEVKLDATGSSTRLIFTNKSNADPFVVRAEISN